MEAAGYVFAHMLLRKLPNETRNNLNRANNNKKWTLKSFREAVQEEITHLSSLQDMTLEDKPFQPEKPDVVFANNHTASFQVTTKLPKTKHCCLYSGDHTVLNCYRYKSTESKKARVKELRLCYNCLYNNHGVQNCLNKSNCKACGRRHHTALCDKRSPNYLGNASPKINHKTSKSSTNKPTELEDQRVSTKQVVVSPVSEVED